MSTMTRTPRTMTARRSRIAAIIATHRITSQDELGNLLGEEGITVTQATLSRDLEAIGAVKVAGGDGHAHYVLSEAASDTSIPVVDHAFGRVLSELLLGAESSGAIAVLRTPPGAAQFLAGHVDRSPAFDTVGTVAGDDTVIIVMRSPQDAEELCTTLLNLAELRRAL